MKKSPLKVYQSVRVDKYELTKAKALATKMEIKFSDYFSKALILANDKFVKELKCSKWW